MFLWASTNFARMIKAQIYFEVLKLLWVLLNKCMFCLGPEKRTFGLNRCKHLYCSIVSRQQFVCQSRIISSCRRCLLPGDAQGGTFTQFSVLNCLQKHYNATAQLTAYSLRE